jgi:hypothetical protein
LLRRGSTDAVSYLREQLGDSELTINLTKPSLEDVFVASTGPGDGI